MTDLTVGFHNVETDEFVERKMNSEELAQLEQDVATGIARDAERAAKATEKEALLAQLGITADQAKLLLS
jgi:FMN-dependent NADH-azoreductase